MNSKMKFHIAGVKKILIRSSKYTELMKTSAPLQGLFGRPPERPADGRGPDLVDFLKQVAIFEDFQQGDLKRLARIVHERSYGDGEYIYKQGTPGTAMYIVRSGIVELLRRKRNGEEVPMALLEPPFSFAELAALGGEVVQWMSARARGPVSLVAIARSDMDNLSRNFPSLANKILVKLAQVMAMWIQTLLEPEYLIEESER